MWSSATERPEDGSNRPLAEGLVAVGLATGVDAMGVDASDVCMAALWSWMTESCKDGVAGSLIYTVSTSAVCGVSV